MVAVVGEGAIHGREIESVVRSDVFGVFTLIDHARRDVEHPDPSASTRGSPPSMSAVETISLMGFPRR
jgi:hypothetical protein